jgi:hypothetical protein
MELDLRIQSQFYLGLFEREVYSWLHHLSRGIGTAIDIGAADGEYTLYFLTRTNAQRVLTFEPSSETRPRLLQNLMLNGMQRSPRLSLVSQFVGSNRSGETSLDMIMPLVSAPTLIKLDIDGGEVEVLRGATRLLALPDTRWLIETHTQQLEDECIAILQKAGFETKVVPQAWWRLVVPEMRASAENRWLVAARRLAR